ncbi:MAG: hypothetical protein QOC99_1154, partial [Acidobacteriota bacterium]|nr:hypothetical protein [Acidobacteriota bacterium]
MKSNQRIAATLSLVLLMLAPTFALAQKQKKNEKHQQPAQKAAQKPQADERLEPDDKSVVRPDVP